MENKEIVIIRSSYTDAQKRATAKYRSNNKEKLNEQRKRYYQCRKQRDENFLAYKREKAKEYYQRKKLEKSLITLESIITPEPEPVITPEPEPVITPEPEPEPIIVETVKVKKTRKINKKNIKL